MTRPRRTVEVAALVAAAALALAGCSGDEPDPRPSGSSSASGSGTAESAQALATSVLGQVSAPSSDDLGHAAISDRDGTSVVYTVTSLRADEHRTMLTLSVRNDSSAQSFVPSSFSGVENPFGHDLHGLGIADKAGNLRVTPYRYLVVPDKPTMACLCVRERFLRDVPQQWTIELPPVSSGAATVDVQIPDDRETRVFGPVRIGATIKDVPVQRG